MKNGLVIEIGRLGKPKTLKSPITIKNMKAYTIGHDYTKFEEKLLQKGLVIEINACKISASIEYLTKFFSFGAFQATR